MVSSFKIKLSRWADNDALSDPQKATTWKYIKLSKIYLLRALHRPSAISIPVPNGEGTEVAKRAWH
jgi:hypothetical protein